MTPKYAQPLKSSLTCMPISTPALCHCYHYYFIMYHNAISIIVILMLMNYNIHWRDCS